MILTGPLHVVGRRSIPELGVHVRVGVRGEGLRAADEHAPVFAVAEVRRRFAVRMVDGVEDDPDVDLGLVVSPQWFSIVTWMPRLLPRSAISLYDSMALSRGARFVVLRITGRGIVHCLGPDDGPIAWGEFIRTDPAPRIFAPVQPLLPDLYAGLPQRDVGGGEVVGASFEMCWTRCRLRPSPRRACPSDFSRTRSTDRRCPARTRCRRSRRRTARSGHPCGSRRERVLREPRESSIVIWPYFSFICAYVIRSCRRLPCSGARLPPATGRLPRSGAGVALAPPGGRAALEDLTIRPGAGREAIESRLLAADSAIACSRDVNLVVAAVKPAPAVSRNLRRSTVASARVTLVMIIPPPYSLTHVQSSAAAQSAELMPRSRVSLWWQAVKQ